MTIRRFVSFGFLPAVLAWALACSGEPNDGPADPDPSAEPVGQVSAPFNHRSPDQPTPPPAEGTVVTEDTTPGTLPGAPKGVAPTEGPAETTVPAVTPAEPQTPVTTSCPSATLLTALGEPDSRLLVGASMTDDVASGTPWDMRYLYLAGGVSHGANVCTACGSCDASGWWGCWQDPALAPGQYVRDFLSKSAANNQLPVITYYEWLTNSGLPEGKGQVAAAADPVKMRRYFNDFRFVLQQVGQSRALLHIEPDLHGYAQGVNENPSAIPAAVASANPTDCSGMEESFAGVGKCMVGMVRKYAPNAKVGIHASSWATDVDAMQNRNASTDIDAIARRTADFLLASGGAESDFIALEVSDRDAGWYELQGQNRWFDAQNVTLPHYAQAFRWATTLTSRMGKPALWWQVPVGNMGLPNTHQAYKDNRVDYFLSHMNEVADTGAFGVLFGAGLVHQTNPSTDQGYLVSRATRYLAGAGEPSCP